MIELKDIKKTYKSKKGLSTEALKGVSINFSEKGLTFILGKSGSGKSTLLNILGGLDSYTSGDIIINGKSTKDFKEKDWDAYRNTYMGFVFQEFNLLDNYTIEDNIKLALELQHKKASSQEILEVLREVDLEDVLKRKPNELSGGQKQRVAIARALIKNPEIILLDEPTGNLDSTTSTQIFEILKKMSKDKLVVVVSHDEESAKKYADRIIKISDGLIESDNGNKITKSAKDFKLVNAKLPFFYSFKMGLGNLFHKKIRLVFSMLLIVLCLICFGTMLSALNSDVNAEYIKIFEEKGSTEVNLAKYDEKVSYEHIFEEELKHLFDMDYSEDIYPEALELDDNFLNKASSKTNMKWYGQYKVKNNFENIMWVYDSSSTDNTLLYYYIGDSIIATEMSLIKIDEDISKDLNIIGSLPVNDNEVVISSYIAEQIMFEGIKSKVDKNSNETEVYKPTSFQQIVNDNIYVNFGDLTYVKIVGIADYSDYMKKYSKLKEVKASTMWDMDYEDEGYEELEELYMGLAEDAYRFLTRVYVSESFINKIDQKEENLSNSVTKIIYNDNSYNVDQFGYINKEIEVFKVDSRVKVSNIGNNEIIINKAMLDIITNNDFSKKLEENMLIYENTLVNEFLNNYLKDNSIIGKKVKTSVNNDKIYNDSTNFAEYTIVGVINDELDYGLVYYNKDVVESLIIDNLSMVSIFTKVNTVSELKTIIDIYPINNSDVLSSSKYSETLLSSIYISVAFNLIGKYGTIFFLIFASILLMNFINNSIKFRKKEIGILRAIGCRSIDVIKMFMYECLTLVIICLAISFVIIPKIVSSVNSFAVSTMYSEIDVMNFGILQVLGVSLVMLLIVVLASIIPIRKLTKMKPIDTILDK